MTLRDRLRRFGRWLIPTGGVAERTVKSGIWVSFSNISHRLLQIVLVIILARLLEPRDFGLMGIALLTIGSLKHLTNLGIDEALIQKKADVVDGYLDTVFTLEILRGLLISGSVFLAAPYIAGFFGEPRAMLIIQVIAFSPLVMSVRNPGIVYFQKDLEFHKLTLYRLSYSVTRFVVGVVYAFISPTVWALVVSYMIADLTRLAVSYLAHGYRPWPDFDLERAKELINYGKWITGGSILYWLYSQGDDVVVGWVLSATSLGFYQVAYQLANAPGTEISGIVRKVMFPSFSKLQGDMDALREAFYRTVQVVTFVAFPAAVGIAVVAPTFVEAFMGRDWLPMVTAMQLLAVNAFLLSLTNTYSPVWKALDRPDYGTKLATVRVVLLAILIYPMTAAFGIEGTAMTVAGIFIFPMLWLDTYLVINILDGSYLKLAMEVVYPGVASLAMGITVVAVERTLVVGSPILEFLVLVLVGVVAYALAVAVIVTQFRWGLEQNIRSLVRSVR